MQVLRRGTSDMDAARGVKGFYAGPRSNTGGREVERSETRMQGRILFGYFLLCEARESDAPEGAQTN